MDLPKRKPNRLKDYDYSQNGGYFVTICTKGRKPILGRVVGGDALIAPQVKLSSYGVVVTKYLRSIPGIDTFIVMPNHIHLIIKIDGTMWASSPTPSISSRIRSFKIMVTKSLGTAIFQRSFHDHVIRDENDYRKIWEYIDTNPAKWEEDCFYCK